MSEQEITPEISAYKIAVIKEQRDLLLHYIGIYEGRIKGLDMALNMLEQKTNDEKNDEWKSIAEKQQKALEKAKDHFVRIGTICGYVAQPAETSEAQCYGIASEAIEEIKAALTAAPMSIQKDELPASEGKHE